MADPMSKYLGEGKYGSQSAETRALKRIENRNGGTDTIPAKELVKPEPNPEWHERAKTLYVCAVSDEASDMWSSGDWLRLNMTCDYYSDMLNGRTRYSAQALEIVFAQLNELRLSDRVKNADGIFVARGEESTDEVDDYIAGVIAGQHQSIE
jgi:hypothetical protein